MAPSTNPPSVPFEEAFGEDFLEIDPHERMIALKGEMGRLVYQLRTRKDVSQEELGNELGFSADKVSKIEFGHFDDWEDLILIFVALDESNKFIEIINNLVSRIEDEDQQKELV